jgi:hypothetical protein
MKLLAIAFTLFFFVITETNAQTPPPTTLLESNQIDGNYGWYISNAGDINADGLMMLLLALIGMIMANRMKVLCLSTWALQLAWKLHRRLY